MPFPTLDRERSGADSRDLRRPETLLSADTFASLATKLPAAGSILDVGGTIAGLVDMARKGFAIHVESLPIPGPDSRSPSDLRPTLEAADSAHDAVLVPGAFFFLPKGAAGFLFGELRRVLRPGGWAFAAFPPLWNPSLAAEALLDAVAPDGPDADIVRRGSVSVRYAHYTSREIDRLAQGFSSPHLVTQKNGVRRLFARRPPA